MTWWQRLRHERRLERELDAELRDHLERQAADYAAQGMPEGEARRRANLEFGGLEQIKETCRDARGLGLVRDAGRDARYAFRMLRMHPGFSLVAILALGLGIGANTAIFSLINGLLFRELAVDRPDRLVFVGHCMGTEDDVARLRRHTQVFSGVAGWTATQFSIESGAGAEWVDGLWVTPGYFEMLGVAAVAGRIAPAADRRELVISERFWRARLLGAPDAVGRTLAINHVPFTIAGIAPAEFTGLDVGRSFDVVAPLAAAPLVAPVEEDGCGPLSVIARLAPRQTIDTAARALAVSDGRPPVLQPAGRGRSDLRPRYERPLLTIMGVAGLVLLTACATLANLLLARAAARRRELGVRLALGASRFRLLRQMAIESLALGTLGALVGLGVAWWASRAIVGELAAEGILATGRTIFGNARLFLDVSLDGTVLAFTTAVTVTTTVLFGMLPALRASRVAPVEVTHRANRRAAPRPHVTAANGLVACQVALSFGLVVAAGLFARSLSSLGGVPLGFEPERMIVVDMSTAPSPVPAVRMSVYERARESVRVLEGVTEATLSVSAPMTGWDLLVEVETGRESSVPGANDSLANIVSPGWFRTLGTRLLAGRDFTDGDRSDTPPVVIVNETFARQFLHAGSPLGRTVTIRGMGPERTPREIVGVAADALWSLRDPVPPILYVPMAQADGESLELRVQEHGLTLAVRGGDVEPDELTARILSAVQGVNRDLVLTRRSPAEHISASLTQERVIAVISGFFALLGLVLAAVSLYGIAACAASRRRGEIGIRLALGGTPAGVAPIVIGPIVRMVALGVAAGAVASAALAPLLSTLLYGVGARDVLTFSAAAVTLSIVAAVSGWVPAYRAARVTPVCALRLD